MEGKLEEVEDNKENIQNSQIQETELQSQNQPQQYNPIIEPIKKALQPVEIIYSTIPKPYLGGFKSLKTGLVYHHAFAQTDQIAREHKTKFHRDVKTKINWIFLLYNQINNILDSNI